MFIKDIEILFDLLIFKNIEKILEYFFQSSELINKEKFIEKNDLQKNIEKVINIGKQYLKVDELCEKVAYVPFVRQFHGLMESRSSTKR